MRLGKAVGALIDIVGVGAPSGLLCWLLWLPHFMDALIFGLLAGVLCALLERIRRKAASTVGDRLAERLIVRVQQRAD
jgi:hypothetical protein